MTVIDPEQWVLVSAQFDEAVELSDDLRSAWLARLGVEQPSLAKQVKRCSTTTRRAPRAGF